MMPAKSPPRGARIDVHVGDVRQLFNSMDPSPFRERDLDPKAEAYIVDSARAVARRKGPLHLAVSLSGNTSPVEDLAALPLAVHEYFARRGAATRTGLRRLLRIGGWSLLIGVSFVAATNLIGDWVHEMVGSVLHESFMIGAWVALWRPLEILLYDWWPMLADARLFDRLADMAVEVRLVQQPAQQPI
jgi:hypothetical protein